jgi:hypothetical protein
VRIAFADFWPGFDERENYFTSMLDRPFELSSDPKLCFFSGFGSKHRKYPDSLKVLFTGENVRPNYRECDYSLSFDLESYGEKNLRWPLYNLYCDPKFDSIVEERDKFCCMVVSNAVSSFRLDFFRALSRYRQVDSGGKTLNNVGGPVPDKLKFLSGYKFSIAFENSYYPGYTTEKLLDAKRAGCVPIYWGNPEVGLDFNLGSFVNVNAFSSFSESIQFIEHLDKDASAFKAMQSQPLLPKNDYTEYSDKAVLREWLSRLISEAPSAKKNWNMPLSWLEDRSHRRQTRKTDRNGQKLIKVVR